MQGPKDTPYAKGIFFLHLKFPKDYPERNPEIVFLTPIYHPNVNPYKRGNDGPFQLGYVCVSFINWWKKETTPREILTRLYSIFYLTCSQSGYDLKICMEIQNNYSLYALKEKYFTQKYACIPPQKELYDESLDFSLNENYLNYLSPITEKK